MTPGDHLWEARHGRMSGIDRWRYAAAAVKAKLGMLANFASSRGYRRDAWSRIDLSRIDYPDTACAKAATQKLEALASPSIAHHSYRSYIWASLLGQLDGRRWDAEVLYVAMMVHDLGLTEGLHGTCPCAQCFTLDSVYGSQDVFEHTTTERAQRMRQAVLLHLNIEVPGQVHGWEAHYVRAGTSLDVVGQRYAQLPPSAIDATLAKYPRLHLKQEIVDWIDRESRLRPTSRFALLKRLGFSRMVRQAPFEA